MSTPDYNSKPYRRKGYLTFLAFLCALIFFVVPSSTTPVYAETAQTAVYAPKTPKYYIYPEEKHLSLKEIYGFSKEKYTYGKDDISIEGDPDGTHVRTLFENGQYTYSKSDGERNIKIPPIFKTLANQGLNVFSKFGDFITSIAALGALSAVGVLGATVAASSAALGALVAYANFLESQKGFWNKMLYKSCKLMMPIVFAMLILFITLIPVTLF